MALTGDNRTVNERYPEFSERPWSEAARRVLAERYLWRRDGRVVEDPDGLCARVAAAVAAAEAAYGAPAAGPARVAAWAGQFAALLRSRRFLPNSPTLMNAGKANGQQLSACYVLPVPDSMAGIFDALKAAALIHKSGGGTGFSFSRLRPAGSLVGATQGVASGPVSFMRVFDAATEHVKQGGTRRGANMGILRVDHPDILAFIDCKRAGGIVNFNISVAITDAFMAALEADGEYELVAPHSGAGAGRLRARAVFERIAAAAWATGDPGLVFLDRINASAANPTPALGAIEATNPCGEQPLLPWEACNLGSVNLAAYLTATPGADAPAGHEPRLAWGALATDVAAMVRFLDDVIDVNPYPLPEIAAMVTGNRRIGLGVMGWADLLAQLGLPYASDAALRLAGQLGAWLARHAWAASEALAAERGPFPHFAQSRYAGGPPRRNCTVTTIAPTGTISILADCSSGIEPYFALAFEHRVGPRVLAFVNPYLERALRAAPGLAPAAVERILAEVSRAGTLREVAGVPEEVRAAFQTAHEVAPSWHVRHQAAWQAHTDNAVSKTINLPRSATVADVAAAYRLAWATGCKGITVFRDGCKGAQVLHAGLSQPDEAKAEPAAPPQAVAPALPTRIKPRPALVRGYTRQIKAPEGTVNITVNSDGEGPVEIFLNVGRAGSDIAALAEAVGRLISLNLRLPSPMSPSERMREMAGQLRGIGGSRAIGLGPSQVRSLPDAVAQALEFHLANETTPASQAPGNGPESAANGQANGHHNGHGQGNGHSTQVELAARATLTLTGNLCPSCRSASAFVYEEGCRKCHACGYSEC